MAGTEDIIAGAMAAARDEGVIEPEDTGDDAVADSGEETTTEEVVVPEGEEVADGDKPGEETPGEGEEEVVADEPPVGEVKPETKKPVGENKELDELLGVTKNSKGKNNPIPYDRVVKIVPNLVEKALKPVFEGVAEDLGLDKSKVSVENFRDAVKSVFAEVPELRERVSAMDVLEPIMRTKGEAFIRILAMDNPEQYGKFVDFMDGKITVNGEVRDDNTEDPMPKPDLPVTLPDGTKGMTYSAEGDAKRVEWLQRQITRNVMKEVEKKTKPFEDERRAKDDAKATKEEVARALKTTLEEWGEVDGFTENAEAIRTYMREKVDAKIPFKKALRMAYNAVVINGWKDKAAKARENALAELRKAPVSVNTPGNTGAPPKKPAIVRGEDGEPVDGTEATVRSALQVARARGILK